MVVPTHPLAVGVVVAVAAVTLGHIPVDSWRGAFLRNGESMNICGGEEGLVFSRFLLLYFSRDQSHEQSLSRPCLAGDERMDGNRIVIVGGQYLSWCKSDTGIFSK